MVFTGLFFAVDLPFTALFLALDLAFTGLFLDVDLLAVAFLGVAVALLGVADLLVTLGTTSGATFVTAVSTGFTLAKLFLGKKSGSSTEEYCFSLASS